MAVHQAFPAAELAEGKSRAVEIEGQSILVCRSGSEVFAVQNRCTHAQSELEGGRIRQGRISCPLHGALFELRTGRSLNPALGYAPLKTYAVREAEGMILLDLP
jgi:3-phenylpropionate/trans-cinnamate dioxygenase ferredoxin subunit